MRYILNSAVITAPGTYAYKLITAGEAKRWIDESDPWPPLSTIGYQETCDALELVTGWKPPCNRQQIQMQPGDEALIFRLTCRLDDPARKGRLSASFVLRNCEIGLLRREA